MAREYELRITVTGSWPTDAGKTTCTGGFYTGRTTRSRKSAAATMNWMSKSKARITIAIAATTCLKASAQHH